MVLGKAKGLQADHLSLVKGTTDIMQKGYEYYADGKLKYVEDEMNDIFDIKRIYRKTL